MQQPDPPPHDPSQTTGICWGMAHVLFPYFVANDAQRLLGQLSRAPRVATLHCYLHACLRSGLGPRDDLVDAFPVHTGRLGRHTRYYVVEYPAPAPVNAGLMDLPDEELLEALGGVVLGPHFSAVLEEEPGGNLAYFLLGQSPDGRTTLRGVSGDLNANLGPGSDPDLESFLALLRERLGLDGPGDSR